MKKIRLISSCEEIINKGELQELRDTFRQCHRHVISVAWGDTKYEAHRLDAYSAIYVVYAMYTTFKIPVKYFRSGDAEYNRLCAEELVELLNSEQ